MPRFALTLLSLLFALPPLQAQFNQPGQVDTTFNFGVPHSEFASAPSEIFGEGTVGTVSTVRQSSGKLVLGLKLPIGLYNGVETTTILRLKHNGYLDRTFNVGTGPLTAANMPSSISALAVQQDDKLLVAGDFTSLNGEPRFGLARLLPDGALDHTFDAGTGSLGSIEKILVHSDGTIYVAGNFSNFNGSGRKGIARLLPSGAVDNTFNAGNVPVADLWNVVLLDNGTVVLSGAFTNFNGHSKQHIVRLLADGSVDTGYNAGNLTSTPITNIAADGNRLMILETVSVIGTVMNRFLEDGTLDPAFRDVIVLGLGGMTEANGLCKIGSDWIVYGHRQDNTITMIRFNSNATLDPGFQFQFNGKFGDFYHVKCYEGYGITLGISLSENLFYTGNSGFTLLDSETGKFADFNKRVGPAFLDYTSGHAAIYDVKQSPEDGRLLIGGTFTHFNGEYTPSLCWLNIDGTVAIKNPGDHHADYVAKVHILNNGKVMAKGNFTEYSGVSVKDLIRLHADLTLDQTFQSELETNSSADDFFVQPDNKILVLVNDTSLIRLNADGTRDYSFAGNIGQVTINSNSQHKTPLEIKADGSFLFAGSIKINNNWVPGLFSFEANGTLSKSVLQLNSGDISGIRLGVDGSILLYGYLLTVNNVYYGGLIKVDLDGVIDTTVVLDTTLFYANYFDENLSHISRQPNGKIVALANFDICTNACRYVTRFNANGALDSTFHMPVSDDDFYGSYVQADGSILLFGDQSFMDGLYRPRIVRLLGDNSEAAALDSVWVSSDTLTLGQGQQLALFARVPVGDLPLVQHIRVQSALLGGTISLLDDGLGADTQAGDGIFTASLVSDTCVFQPRQLSLNFLLTDTNHVATASKVRLLQVLPCPLPYFQSVAFSDTIRPEQLQQLLVTAAVQGGAHVDIDQVYVASPYLDGDTLWLKDTGLDGDVMANDSTFSLAGVQIDTLLVADSLAFTFHIRTLQGLVVSETYFMPYHFIPTYASLVATAAEGSVWPRSGMPFVVKAQVADAAYVDSGRVWVQGAGYPATYLNDSGLAGDEVAGDGWYSVRLDAPASCLAADSLRLQLHLRSWTRPDSLPLSLPVLPCVDGLTLTQLLASADTIDLAGVDITATVAYSGNRSLLRAWINHPDPLATDTLWMFDDGTHGDAVAHDGIFVYPGFTLQGVCVPSTYALQVQVRAPQQAPVGGQLLLQAKPGLQCVTIRGTVFKDVNQNGLPEAAEAGLPEYAVELMQRTTTPTLNYTLLQTTSTDDQGHYSFTLPAGLSGRLVVRALPKHTYQPGSFLSDAFTNKDTAHIVAPAPASVHTRHFGLVQRANPTVLSLSGAVVQEHAVYLATGGSSYIDYQRRGAYNTSIRDQQGRLLAVTDPWGYYRLNNLSQLPTLPTITPQKYQKQGWVDCSTGTYQSDSVAFEPLLQDAAVDLNLANNRVGQSGIRTLTLRLNDPLPEDVTGYVQMQPFGYMFWNVVVGGTTVLNVGPSLVPLEVRLVPVDMAQNSRYRFNAYLDGMAMQPVGASPNDFVAPALALQQAARLDFEVITNSFMFGDEFWLIVNSSQNCIPDSFLLSTRRSNRFKTTDTSPAAADVLHTGNPLTHEIAATEDHLRYTFSYVHTGSQATNFLAVRAAVSPNLDINSLYDIHSNHPYTLTREGDTLVWLFSAHSLQPNAQGGDRSLLGLSYKLKLKPNLPPGTLIPAPLAYTAAPTAPFQPQDAPTVRIATGVGRHAATGTLAFALYPNPATSGFTVQATQPGTYHLQVVNTQGQVVQQASFTGTQQLVSTTTLPAGVYSVHLQGPLGSGVQRLVVQ